MRLGPHTITVERAPLVEDTFGNEERNWGSATTADVTGCSVQPMAAPEVVVGRETTVSRWQVWAPATADVVSTDRVVWSGDTYEVDGAPQRWSFPPMSYITVLLRRSESS